MPASEFAFTPEQAARRLRVGMLDGLDTADPDLLRARLLSCLDAIDELAKRHWIAGGLNQRIAADAAAASDVLDWWQPYYGEFCDAMRQASDPLWAQAWQTKHDLGQYARLVLPWTRQGQKEWPGEPTPHAIPQVEPVPEPEPPAPDPGPDP
jgi:hypothetical protein